MPAISIVVPVYKSERYLNQCIDSILNQTFLDYELILVDDGSSDNSPTICDSYAVKDNRIKVIHKENGGVTEARKTGCLHAKGDYITFIDSDDYIASDMLYKMIEKARETDADYVQTGFSYVWENKSLDRTYNEIIFSRDELRSGIIPDFIYMKDIPIPGYACGYICKKEIVDSVMIKIPSELVIKEDRLAMLHILNHLNKAVILSGPPLYFYRQREDSAVHTNPNKYSQSAVFWEYFIAAANSYGYNCGPVYERQDDEFVADIFQTVFSNRTPNAKCKKIKELRYAVKNKKAILTPVNSDAVKKVIGVLVFFNIYGPFIYLYSFLKRVISKNEQS